MTFIEINRPHLTVELQKEKVSIHRRLKQNNVFLLEEKLCKRCKKLQPILRNTQVFSYTQENPTNFTKCAKIHPCLIAFEPTSPRSNKNRIPGLMKPNELEKIVMISSKKTQWSRLQDGPLPVISRVTSPFRVVATFVRKLIGFETPSIYVYTTSSGPSCSYP